MKDRIPTQILPNGAIRYGIYNADGTLNRYEYIKPEDEPTEIGSAINKANLLPDAVATALGLTQADPQPKDAFLQTANNLGVLDNKIKNLKLLETTVSTAAQSISLDLSGLEANDYAEIVIYAIIFASQDNFIRCTINNRTSTNNITGYFGSRIRTDSTSVSSYVNSDFFGEFGTVATTSTNSYATNIKLNVRPQLFGTGATNEYAEYGIDFVGGSVGSSRHVLGHAAIRVNSKMSSVQFISTGATPGNILAGSKFFAYGVKI